MFGKKSLLSFAVLAVLTAFGGYRLLSAQDTEKRAAVGGQAKGKELGGDELAKLGKARAEAAKKAYEAYFQPNRNVTFSLLRYQLSLHWLNAELDAATKKEERVAAYTGHLRRMEEWQKYFPEQTTAFELVAVLLSLRKEAEFWLVKERSAQK